jgi:hypothetical protein
MSRKKERKREREKKCHL